MDSSSEVVWSAIGFCLPGSSRRGSDSTMTLPKGDQRVPSKSDSQEEGDSLKVDDFVRQTGLVLEAEAVLADGVGGEDIVTLALADAVEDDLFVRVLDIEVYVERATSLDLGMLRLEQGANTQIPTAK